MTNTMNNEQKINPDFKEKWLKELRNPKYKQAISVFKDTNKKDCYCALGLGLHANGFKFKGSDHIITGDGTTCGFKVLEKAANMNGKQWETVYGLNDGKRMSLPEIADWVEENL